MSLSSAPFADSSALMAFFALIFVSSFWRMPAFSVRWFASTCGGRRGEAGAAGPASRRISRASAVSRHESRRRRSVLYASSRRKASARVSRRATLWAQ